jgi:hypothetical protein
VWRKKKNPFTRERERPLLMMLPCSCLKNPFKLLELLLLLLELLSILSAWKNCIDERGILEDVLWSEFLWFGHPTTIARNENSSLFWVWRFVRKLGTKLRVWRDQHICYSSEKVSFTVDFYHMETKGRKNNIVLLGKWCQMSKLS